MNKVIYKYPLGVTDFQKVLMPVGAEILICQTQFGEPKLWAFVNPNEINKEYRNIEIFGTGHIVVCDMGISRKYISTFQMYGGQSVFHVFECIFS